MQTPPSSSTVILGSAAGLGFEQIRPFLASLRRTGYAGDLALVADRRLRRALRREPLARGVVSLPSRLLVPDFRRLRSNRVLWALWRPVQALAWAAVGLVGRLPLGEQRRQELQGLIAQGVCTPMEARFLTYARFLRGHAYDRVLLTDVRDVLFQSDPFPQLPADGLAVSMETRQYTVATERHNASWVKQAYGPEMLSRIGDKPVSCVGVTYGERRAIATYLGLLCAELLRLPAAAARRGGADTAMHNVLLWTGRLGRVELLETLESPVATLNGLSPALDSAGRLLNRDGSEPSIVHQYDRVPAITAPLLRSLTGLGDDHRSSENR